MNTFKVLLALITTCAPIAAFADNETTPWTVKVDGDDIVISTLAVDGNFCRPEPAVFEISCIGDVLAASVESGCVPRPFGDGTVNILVTHVFDPGPNRLFDHSSMWSFMQEDGGPKYYAEAGSLLGLLEDVAKFDTVSFGIENGVGEVFEQPPTSHFDVSYLAEVVKYTGMDCGIRELISQ